MSLAKIAAAKQALSYASQELRRVTYLESNCLSKQLVKQVTSLGIYSHNGENRAKLVCFKKHIFLFLKRTNLARFSTV